MCDDVQAGYCRNPHHGRIDSGETGSGETVEQILEAHPRLTREAIKANAGIRRQSIAGRRCLPYKRDKLMNFPADESVDFPVVRRLGNDGDEVLYVAGDFR